MRISAKADYAVRAATALASSNGHGPVNAKDIAVAHAIPLRFLETILADLRNGGIVSSRRGFGGGYMLTRAAGPRCSPRAALRCHRNGRTRWLS
jgi:Rrf2 family protein